MRILYILLAFIFIITACNFEKKIDASSEKTMQSSVKIVMEGLSDKDKELFQKSLQVIMFDGVNNLADLAMMGQNIEVTKAAFLTKIDGKTAKQIIKMAEKKGSVNNKKTEAITADDIARNAREDIIKQTLDAKLLKKSILKDRYSDSISLDIAFKNITDKNIKGFKGTTIFKDMFGDIIYKATVSIDDAIKAGELYKYSGVIDINQFIDSNVKLATTPIEKIDFSFDPKVVIFEDGTKISVE